MIRLILISITALFASCTCFGQGYVWTTQTAMGRLSGGGRAIVDASGNVYVAGGFHGNLSAEGGVSLTNSGNADIFLLKLDNTGKVLWANRAGGPGGDEARDLALDSDGNVIIAGGFQQTAFFGNTPITALGNVAFPSLLTNMFVAKYTSGGALVWVRSQEGVAGGVAVDGAGHIYTAGSMGPYINPAIDKWDGSGTRIWHREYPCAYSHISTLKVDRDGNIYPAGYFSTSITIGTNLLSTPVTGTIEVFVAKLNPDGEVIWARQTDHPGIWRSLWNSAKSLAIDPSGDLLITGIFNREIRFGTNQLATGSQDWDSYLAKCDKNGNFLWAQPIARDSGDDMDVVCDSAGNIYTVCSSTHSLVFQKYNPAGSPMWSLSAAGYAYGHGLAIDKFDLPYVVASCNGNVSFDAMSFTNQGGGDVYISQVSEIVPPVFTSHPRSKTCLGGTNVQFGCLTRSLVPVSYQWRLNSIEIPGATTSSLSLTNVGLASQGTYDVVATNVFGATTSAPGRLDLLFKLTTHIAGSGKVLPDIGWTNIYTPLSNVVVSATPEPGFSFTGWSGDISGSENPLSIAISSNMHIWAVFSDSSTNLVVDNADVNASFKGSWSYNSIFAVFYGPNSRSTTTRATSTSEAVFRPNITVSGVYDVYLWYPKLSKASFRAPWTITCHSGSTNILVDQNLNTETWVRIAANQFFAAGTNGFVSVSDGTGEYNRTIVADAVRFLKTSPPSPLVQAPTLSENGLSIPLITVPGLRYSVQTSTNLMDWKTIETFESTNTVLQIRDHNIGTADRRYYRAMVEQ